MLKLDEGNAVKIKTTVQGRKRTPYTYLVKALFDNDMGVKPGQELDIGLEMKKQDHVLQVQGGLRQ